MFKIINNKIQLTRGDTFRATLDITDSEGNTFNPSSGDVIRFAMKKQYSDDDPLIKKIIQNGLLQLDPQDTSGLPFGDYVYDIEITYANGDVDTFIERCRLKLTEEVD